MREIKFRLIKNDKIVGYESYTRFSAIIHEDLSGNQAFALSMKWSEKAKPVGKGIIPHDSKDQFTGLLDYQTKEELYQDDVVVHKLYGSNRWIIGIIKWNKRKAAFEVTNERYYPDTYKSGKLKQKNSPMANRHISKLGNIHENPELLKEKGD